MSLLMRSRTVCSLRRCRQVSVNMRNLVQVGASRDDEPQTPKPLPFTRYKAKSLAGDQSDKIWHNSPWTKQTSKHRDSEEIGSKTDLGPSTTWIYLPAAPSLLATLDDVLRGMYKLLEAEASNGIIDLDAEWAGGDAQVPFLRELPEIQSALLSLSSHGRPRGWRLDVGNRSVVHHLLERSKKEPLYLNYKSVRFEPCNIPGPSIDPAQVEHGVVVSDSVVRVEGCSDHMTIDHLRHLLRRFDMAMDAPTIVRWDSKEYHFNTFLVRFSDPSWARAAIRELQGKLVHDRPLALSQFPRQLHKKVEQGGERTQQEAATATVVL